MRYIILDFHSTVLAGLLTLLTADTTDIALHHNSFTAFCTAAGHVGDSIVRNQGDQMLWAGSDTFAAGFTFFFVYNSYAVNNMDSIERTGFGAVAKAKTAVAADF